MSGVSLTFANSRNATEGVPYKAMARLPKTPGDYLIIGVSPALIMLLVGSVVFFLVEVFYQGEYAFRLSFIFAMFVMATVAVARISMAEGAGYAAMFGAPLALVTFIALVSFVQVSGALAAVSWLVNIVLIAFIWWCSHKLTWDCTLIDETQDASGQGLLQSIGLDGEGPPDNRPMVKLPLWERWFGEKKKQAKTPGLWVIYFSLGALPLYGVLQWFVATESRLYTFGLLVVYVASGLALLLTTSFLGLRRYLRQRQLEMPADMAAVWVGVGSIMIVALLIVCVVLPRPGAENAISSLPFSFNSPIKMPSKWGFGKDGPQDNKLGTKTGPQSQSDGQQPGGQSSGDMVQGSGNQQSPGPVPSPTTGQPPDPTPTPGQPPPTPQPIPAGQNVPPSQPGQLAPQPGQTAGPIPTPGQNPQPGQTPSPNQQPPSGNQPPDPAQQTNNSASGGSLGAGKPANQQDPANATGTKHLGENRPSASASADNQRPAPPTTASKPSNSSDSSGFMAKAGEFVVWLVGSMFKLMFYTVLAVVIGFFAWRYRKEVVAAVKKFLEELRALWLRLFGRKSKSASAAAEAGPAKPVYKRFADFSDPFTSGLASRFSPVELVRYTFEAVEAWGREHDCPASRTKRRTNSPSDSAAARSPWPEMPAHWPNSTAVLPTPVERSLPPACSICSRFGACWEARSEN